MIENAGDNGVGEFLDGFGAGIKIWVWRKQQGAGMEEEFHVLYVYEAKRGFAGAEDEFLILLEHHIGGAEQGVFAVAVGNAAEGTHGAGQDDHCIKGIGAAGERDIHALGRMQWHALGKLQSIG